MNKPCCPLTASCAAFVLLAAAQAEVANQTAAAADLSFTAANSSAPLAAPALAAAFAAAPPALLNATAGKASRAAVGVAAAAPVRDFLDCQAAGGAWVRADRHFDDVIMAVQVPTTFARTPRKY